MTPSFQAFTNELFLIKVAAEEKEPRHLGKDIGRKLLQMGIYAAGFGLGGMAGELIGRHIPENILAHIPEPLQKHIPTIMGALGMATAMVGTEAVKSVLAPEKTMAEYMGRSPPKVRGRPPGEA